MPNILYLLLGVDIALFLLFAVLFYKSASNGLAEKAALWRKGLTLTIFGLAILIYLIFVH